MENIEEIKKKLECIRGITYMGLDKIWFKEEKKITQEQLEEELKACKDLLKTFIGELEGVMENGK